MKGGTFCRDCEQKIFTVNADGTISGCPNAAPEFQFGHINDDIKTLINSPKVILLDEPMAALDPIIVQDIQKFILKLQSYGCGIIITDHQVQNLFEIVDRAYVIGEQTIVASGKPKDILKSTKARELYFGSLEN